MSFLYPQFLLGLFAVSIPIIIHLFNFQRPRKILFSNVKFLREVKETTSSKLKLKHYLILLSRILFIIFLVLTFAQPFWESDRAASIRGKQTISLYLDNSFSMQNEVNKEKNLDIAIKSANQLSEVYPANSTYYFLTNDFEGKDLYYRNKEKLSERLTEVKYSNLFKEGEVLYKRQTQVLENEKKQNHHIFWFTDFQKSTIGDLNKIKIDTADKLYLVPFQNENSENIYVDSIWLENPMVKVNENNNLIVQVYNEGDKEVKDIVLKLYIENVQVSTSSISIPAKSSAKSKFTFNVSGGGQKKCKISFEDFPVTFDNEYYFVLNISPKIKILHLYQDENKSLPNVYSNESIFDIQSSSYGDFDHSLLGVSNLVILENLNEIPTSIISELKEFINKGGSLVIYPSEKLNIDSYNDALGNFQLPKITKQTIDTTSDKLNASIIPPDIRNPFFKGMYENIDKSMNMPYAYSVIQWPFRGETLLRIKNETPFLSLFQKDKGKVYLFSTPLKGGYTNLTNHSIFVLIMYKMAFNSIVEGERLAFNFQEPVMGLDVDFKDGDNIFSLVNGDFKIIPGQRIIGKKLLIDIPKDQMKPGFYEVHSKDSVEKIMAINYGKQESIMEFYKEDELKKIFGQYKNVQIYNVENNEEFINKFKKENIGMPLWKYCLILCLVFLAIEILLIRFL